MADVLGVRLAPRRSVIIQKTEAQMSKLQEDLRQVPTRSWVIFWAYLTLGFGGVFLHGFFFNIQENFYTGTNDLYQWYLAAGMWQLSLTSASAVFFAEGIVATVLFIVAEFNYTRMFRFILVATVIAGQLVYTAYELYQFFYPTYFDHNFLDIVVAAVANLIMVLPVLLIPPQD